MLYIHKYYFLFRKRLTWVLRYTRDILYNMFLLLTKYRILIALASLQARDIARANGGTRYLMKRDCNYSSNIPFLAGR
jgi:hypothetical protein